jgi:hypothetical protein
LIKSFPSRPTTVHDRGVKDVTRRMWRMTRCRLKHGQACPHVAHYHR